MAEQGTFSGEVQRGWQRFWGASWWVKGPVAAVAAILVLGGIGGAIGDDEDADATADPARTATSGPEDEPTPEGTATSEPSPTETSEPTETPTPSATATPTETPTPTATPTPSPTPEPAGFRFGDGTKLVGDEVVAGATYRTIAGSSCYWERLSGLGGELDDIITNEFGGGSQVVTIGSTDEAFNSSNCGTWTQDIDTPVTESPDGPIDVEGTLIVGVDIGPGTWRADGGDGSCYWERLSGFSGELTHLIANDFGDASPIVQVAASDAGFSSTSCGTWTKLE